MERYWSPVQAFSISPVPTVAETMLWERLRRLVTECVIVETIPVPIITPPNIIAHSISNMVESIPFMPPVDTSESSSSWPVGTDVSDASMLNTAFAWISSDGLSVPSIVDNSDGWNRNMPMTPNSVLSASVVVVPSFITSNSIVAQGMRSVHGVMLNVA